MQHYDYSSSGDFSDSALTGPSPEIECRYHHFLKCSALNVAPNIVLDLPAALDDPAIWKSADLSAGTCDNFGRADQKRIAAMSTNCAE